MLRKSYLFVIHKWLLRSMFGFARFSVTIKLPYMAYIVWQINFANWSNNINLPPAYEQLSFSARSTAWQSFFPLVYRHDK